MATPAQRFGRRLLKVREQRVSESRPELADAIGTDPSSIYRWETGEGGPRADVLLRLMRHYRDHAMYLLFGDADDAEPIEINTALETFLRTRLGQEAARKGLTPVLSSIQFETPASSQLYARIALVLLDSAGDGA